MSPADRQIIVELRALAERLHDYALEPEVYRDHFYLYRSAVTELEKVIAGIEQHHHRVDERPF